MSQRIVVTGGAGFIGSHIVSQLVVLGYRVTVLDDLSSGSLDNLRELLDAAQLELVTGSILSDEILDQAFAGADFICHLAAIPGVYRSVENPLESHQVNATGTLKVLQAARRHGVKKVVFASSSSVYGDTPELPKHEAMKPTPQSPYAVSKLAGEYYCEVFTSLYGLPTVAFRYFNVYGPRQNPNNQYAAVIPAFIQAVSRHRAPQIDGDGQQTRDFTFVADVVSANVLALRSDFTGVYNIGGGSRTSILDLADDVIKTMAADLKPEFRDARPGDVRDSLADISRAAAVGYRPAWTLEAGLRETIRSFNH